ncbi:MAG TPA: hypothetical protein VHL34_14930 [Rhizomicrobium sp.]|jgi:hypothetical protein|nr:hypothetical protein [Rhizomicrobium sp.]
MANYTKQEESKLELALRYRFEAVAQQIPVMHGHDDYNKAIWLFCLNSGNRKITNVDYFLKHLKPGEMVEELRQRLWCEMCRRQGCFIFILAPRALQHMGFNFRKPAAQRLLMSEDYI